MEDKDILIAQLLANTRRKKRPNNLIEIAENIRLLERALGDLKQVSIVSGLSKHMLGQFLTVEDLCSDVKHLVETRQIDLIKVVRNIHSFKSDDQIIVANKLLNNEITANDIKVLEPMRRQFPDSDLNQLISRIINSKNIKVYVAYFHLPPGNKGTVWLKEKFKQIIGGNELISLTENGQIATLEITKLGKNRLLTRAKEYRLSLRKFIEDLVNDKL